MGNYFHSLITTAPLTLAIGFIVLILFLSVRWLQRQLSGQELLEIRSTRILNGERGANVRGSVYEWPARTSSALDVLLSEIQFAHEQRSRPTPSFAPTPRRTPKPDSVTVCSLITNWRRCWKIRKSGSAWRGDDDPLARFQSSARQPGRQSGGRADVYAYQSAIDIYYALPCSLLARYHRSDFAVLLPHRTLKEAESIAGQLLKAVDALPANKMLDRDDMVHIGICARAADSPPSR